MIEKIYWILEILAVLICLSSLNGRRLKVNLYDAVFIAGDILFMQLIHDGIISRQVNFLIYLLCIVYAYLKYSDELRNTVIRCILCALIVGTIQMVIAIPLNCLYTSISDENIMVFWINLILVLMMFFTRKSKIYQRIAEYCIGKVWLTKICICVCTLLLIYCLYDIKGKFVMNVGVFIVITLYIGVVLVVLYQWQKSRYECKQHEKELEISNTYNNAVNELIAVIRKRQHEFHNQIDALYSMNMSVHNYDELVRLQREYSNKILKENEDSKILNFINSPILSGFVYSKVDKARELGIDVDYDILYEGKDEVISVYILVEIIGILMDNAIEAVMANVEVEKKIDFTLRDDGKCLKVIVKNETYNLARNDIPKLFSENSSSKGEGRGLGLKKIKDYQKQYGYSIVTNLENHWITFEIAKAK